ncbi:MAG: hydroxymethylbilane synthase [Hyphomonadaceae bacterium]|nr:hydroxymethylbilane synthase [Hyphomonadaceae bacterium]
MASATSTLLRLGARGSPLSRAQSDGVRQNLAKAMGVSADRIAFVPIVTSGDRNQDPSFAAGGKGIFTKELDDALLDKRIDVAVHSMKDLPAELADGVAIAAVPTREDPRDAFISGKAGTLRELPDESVVGTSSVRRRAWVLFRGHGHIQVAPLRGNVETRLKKVADGVVDATILALAGLKRLGLESHVASLLDPLDFLPAPCQGALALTARAEDVERFAVIDDFDARVATTAERAYLAAFGGSCLTPVGAWCRREGDVFLFNGGLLHPEGRESFKDNDIIPLHGDAFGNAARIAAKRGAEMREIAIEQGILPS